MYKQDGDPGGVCVDTDAAFDSAKGQHPYLWRSDFMIPPPRAARRARVSGPCGAHLRSMTEGDIRAIALAAMATTSRESQDRCVCVRPPPLGHPGHRARSSFPERWAPRLAALPARRRLRVHLLAVNSRRDAERLKKIQARSSAFDKLAELHASLQRRQHGAYFSSSRFHLGTRPDLTHSHALARAFLPTRLSLSRTNTHSHTHTLTHTHTHTHTT